MKTTVEVVVTLIIKKTLVYFLNRKRKNLQKNNLRRVTRSTPVNRVPTEFVKVIDFRVIECSFV